MRRRVLLLLLAAAAFGAVHAPSAFAIAVHPAASGPSATVTPSTGLVDGQVVTIDWSGFPASGPVYFWMCKRGATTVDDCVEPSADPVLSTSDTTGAGVIRFQVDATNFGKFSCGSDDACSIALMPDSSDLTGGATVPITFAPAPNACPEASGLPVAGIGSSSAAYTMYGWENAACQLKSHLNVTYTNDNSYDGISNFLLHNPNADFAVTGVPLAPSDTAKLAKQHLGFAYAPLSLTGVSIGFNIVDQSGNQITNLVLTPNIVAEIATGSLSTFWCPPKQSDTQCTLDGGDPEIRALNPGVKFPTGPIQFSIRAEHSASNLEFTSWLSQNAPSIWTYGTSTTWPPPDPNPCLTCTGGVEGEANAALAVGFPISYTPIDVYVGVMDSTSAAVNDVPVAKLVNPGQPNTGVAPTTASLAAAMNDATANPDGTYSLDLKTSDPNAYPMPMLSYAVVPTTRGYSNFGSDGATLRAFLDYAATQGQTNLPAGSYPLTAALAKQEQAIANKVPIVNPPPGGGTHPGRGPGTGPTGTTGTGTGTTGSGGVGSTGGFGTGNGGGGGGGNGGSGTGTGGAGGSTKTPTAAAATPVAMVDTLTSPASHATVPALVVLALLGLLVGPLVLMRKGRAGLSLGSLRSRLPGRA